MPIGDIQPGQQGECRTVFEGTQVEPFPFVVKDVMPNFLGPGRDLVLIRLMGEKAEFTGVVAGMSGSPCAIDGRLVGALAYSFAAFAKEPIAGITPMQDMLDVMTLPQEERPWRLGDEDLDWKVLRDGQAQAPAPANQGLERIATPLVLGGMAPALRRHFTPWLRGQGFLPVAGSGQGGGTRGPFPATVTPGSAVAAVLVKGDVDISATGTVTSVEGSEVLAFGHPFLGVGAVSFPMATARIHNTMASAQRSFKMSASGPIIGEFTQDRLTAIGGFLGRQAKMVPVTGTVKTPKGPRNFKIEVARDEAMTPRFLAMGLANALFGRIEVGERGTVRVRGEVRVEGLEPVVIRNVYASTRDSNLIVYAAVEVAQAFEVLWSTPFGPPPAIEVSVEAVHETEPVEEFVEAVQVDRAVARPGDMVEVAVRLRRNDGPVSIERFRVPVPRSWAGQEVNVIGGSMGVAEKVSTVAHGRPLPTTLKQVAQHLRERRRDGFVYLMMLRKGSGLRSGVTAMPLIPPSVVGVTADAITQERRFLGVAWEERRSRPGVVVGASETSFRVRPY